MEQLLNIPVILLGCFLPLLVTAMVPGGSQRMAAAIFALIGIGMFARFGATTEPSTFALGLAIGFMLATAKLATGIRFL